MNARESALRSLGRVPLPEAVLSCGAPDVALWLYARGYDHYAVKTELRAYGFDDARYFADVMLDVPAGARQHAEIEAVRAGNAISGPKRHAPSCGRSCGIGEWATATPPKPSDACYPNGSNGVGGTAH